MSEADSTDPTDINLAPTSDFAVHNDDIYMYIIVNSDLKKMQKGKMAAQCCHSACMVMEEMVTNERRNASLHERTESGITTTSETTTNYFQRWKATGHAKVVLKAPESVLLELIKQYSNASERLWCKFTVDEGRTQIKRGSLTTLAFCPIEKSNRPEILCKLKLM